MELQNAARLGPLAGACLSTEELSGLEVAVVERKLEENLVGKIYFWGKIYGSTQDYLVVFNVNPLADFPDKVYYFCTTSNYKLSILPTLSADYIAKAEALKMQFTGDPSVFTFNGEEAEPEDPEAPPVERFRELHRLAYTVKVSFIILFSHMKVPLLNPWSSQRCPNPTFPPFLQPENRPRLCDRSSGRSRRGCRQKGDS
jgi:hypothetical protein